MCLSWAKRSLSQIRFTGDRLWTQAIHGGPYRVRQGRHHGWLADALERITQWMHAKGVAVYDHQEHAGGDAAVRDR
ncbi:hypothetical protein ABZ897_53970 [Nonomuraea sp. NPDC046802]|uniref:hypothetical protein n=1 Tax=Nonomuraea sp. NPDC046802 TaxID=3154919 RepID=UPI0033C7A1AB